MITSNIACVAYITALLFFSSTDSMPVDAHSDSTHHKSAISDLSQLPDEPEAEAMNGDWVDSLHDYYANEGQLSSPPDESEDVGSSSALSDDDPSHKLLNEGEEIPDLPLQNEKYDYPDNIDDFHNDMPRIADTMDGMDYSLFDDEMWQKIDNSMGNISERREILDLKRSLYRDKLRTYISQYLADKLAKKFNVPIVNVPWLQMKADDIINWPPNLEYRSVYRMDINELERLHKLANENQLDFTTEFLERLKLGPVNKWSRKRNQLRSYVTKYLADKLAKKLNVPRITIPWSKMNAKDMINWPSGVEFIPVSKMKINEVKRLHKLSKEDLLDFAPEFLRRTPIKYAENKSDIINDIESTLRRKLNAGTNKKFRRIPWTILSNKDIINWPKGMPFDRLSRLAEKRLKLLHKLREVIVFSDEFLSALSDPSFDRTPIGMQTIQGGRSTVNFKLKRITGD